MSTTPVARRWTAVMRKEWMEVRQGARQGRHGLGLQLATQLVTGIVIGAAWATSLFSSYLTTFGISIVAAGAILPLVGDAIAGERERHTLETLLAFPVPTRTLLAGKLALLVAYASVGSLIVLTTATVTAMIETRGPLAVHWDVVAACLALPVLVATSFAAGGLLLSGRSASARGAQQQLAFILSGMMLVPLALFRLVPLAARVHVLASLQGSSAMVIVALVAGGFLLLDVALVTLVAAHLTRRRLLAAS